MKINTLYKKRWSFSRLNFLRAVVPLLAFVASLGASQSAKAQTQFYDDAITLTKQPTGGTAQNSKYSGKAEDDPYSDATKYTPLNKATSTTTSPDLGAYDLNGTSQLTLVGGEIVADPPPSTIRRGVTTTYTITAARVKYRVYMKGGTAPSYTAVVLPDAGAFSIGGELYQTTNISANLLSGLTLGGRYVLEVIFETDTKSSANVTSTDADPGSTSYQAEFTLTAPPAPTIAGKEVYVTPNGGSQITYNINSSSTPAFQGANLGGVTYDLVTGQLILNGGSLVTTESGTQTITSAVMIYRVRQQGTGGGSFTSINLTQSGPVTSGTRTFVNNSSTINLVSLATAQGSYSLDVYYQASGTDAAGNNFTLADNNNNNATAPFYTASFTVTGNAIPNTVWTGGTNDNWFEDANWTNHVPTANTNVAIANIGSGMQNAYPRIFCNTSYTYTPTDATKPSVVINNVGKLVAVARNLVMNGNSINDKSILSLVVGSLNVGGDFDNRYDSFVASDNTNVAFVGGNQTISGGSFSSISISGGGVKSVQALMNVTSDVTFSSGLLVTDVTQPLVSYVMLAERSLANNQQGGRLVNETDASYLRGFVKSRHLAIVPGAGTDEFFSNVGLGLSFLTSPGEATVTRSTTQSYNPGNGPAVGIRRIFEVILPTVSANSPVQADMRFSYLDSETKNLGSSGTTNIDEPNLTIFATFNKGNTFTTVGRTGVVNTTDNVVSRSAVTTFELPSTTFTLGDVTNPLPVELVAFDAKRLGANTLITWETASEKNSAGFGVQVAVDGTTFKELTFVSSHSVNSTTHQKYSYTDTEAGKSGVRYYRLRQQDLDGQTSYSPIRAVSFAAASSDVAAAVSSYPNPFTANDQAALVLQAPTAGTARLQVTDLSGRTLVNREITTIAGVSEVAVPNASSLATGVYLVKVTFSTGEVKTLRIQKR